MTTDMKRETKETKISLKLDIYSGGKVDIDTDDQFLAHMVNTLAKYAGWGLALSAHGDNAHHTLEDVAIVLGRALHEEIKGKALARIGHSFVAMDDALVMAAVDIIDRPYVDAPLPDEMYAHFIRSFVLEARITLHIQTIRGVEKHHIIEASFKALGRALKEAVKPADALLSTKDAVKWGKKKKGKKK